MNRKIRLPLLALMLACSGPGVAGELDAFDTIAGWSAVAGRGAQASLHGERDRHGSALRVDYDFTRGGGEIIIHKRIPRSLPENFAITLRLRGSDGDHSLELRLVDGTDGNVWRFLDPEYRMTPDWRTLRVRQRRFAFGWGPAGGGPPRDLGWFEVVIGRGPGGRGSLWIDDLRLEALPPDQPYAATPRVIASSARPGHDPDRVLEEPPGSGWLSAAGPESQWLTVDFRQSREHGGLIIDWDSADFATRYRVESSGDGRRWTLLHAVRQGNGGRDYLPVREAESRLVRLRLSRSSRGRGYGIRHLEVASSGFSDTATHLFERLARDAPRGFYPRFLLGEQPWWTVAGSPGDARAGAAGEALLGLDGQLEPGEGSYLIEPFIQTGDGLLSWAEANASASLERGDLPIPSTRLDFGDLELTVTALADARPSRPLLARYVLANRGSRRVDASLFLAVRPFLVNPPWQALHTAGGVASLRRLGFRNAVLRVEGRPALRSLPAPTRAGFADFDGEPLAADLARRVLPRAGSVKEPRGWATGALRYAYSLGPGESREVTLVLPDRQAGGGPAALPAPTDRLWAAAHAATVRLWADRLDTVRFRGPPEAMELVRAARATLAYILVHRDGPALRPGSRRYGRTWIRDGAITSSVLLAFGHREEVREFLRWYAGFQGEDGAMPCCVDPWGPDNMIEHDSVGAFVYTVANYVRHSGDRRLLAEIWPRVTRAVDYLAALRERRLTPPFTQGEARRFHGLLPESASHEGYVAKPMHAYWDDFWALRGFDDAAWLAARAGDAARASRWAGIRDAFREDIERSIALTQARFGIDYVPGCADLGDLDPTSTAIAPNLGVGVTPALLPSLRKTFDRYLTELRARDAGTSNWQAYAPYELRIVTALIRLGDRDAAWRGLRSLLAGRRPAGWNQWPEVVWRNPGAANFIGDLPHTWVGAEYVQALLAMFAFERSENAWVLGAGLPRDWVNQPGGVGIEDLRTPLGRLSYRIDAPAAEVTRVDIAAGLTLPPAGLVVDPPLPGPLRSVELNGRPLDPGQGGGVVVHELPATLLMHHPAGPR